MRRVWALAPTPFLLLLLLSEPARAQTLVSIELVRGERGSVTRGVRNNCRVPLTFELSEGPDVEWFGVVGGPRRLIAPGGVGEFAFEFDSAGMDNGTYTAEVSVNCLGCAKEQCGPRRFPYTLRLRVSRPGDGDPQLAEVGDGEFVVGQVLAALNVKSLKEAEAAASALALRYGLQSLGVFRLRSVSLFFARFAVLDPAAPLASVIVRLERDALVNYAQHVYRYFGSAPARRQDQDYAGRQYALGQIRADLAQKFSDGRGVRVALLDSWVDARHRDLRGRVARGRDFTGGGAGAQDVHGTTVAGIIVADPRNRFGIAGVAPGARIVPVKVLNQMSPQEGPEGMTDTVSRGLDFALSKSRLINMSHGSLGRDPTVVRLVREARRRGVVLVAAAGNDGPGGSPRYPAALEEVIAVSAVDNNRESYARGTRGGYIDLAAPGVDVLSTSPGDRFRYGDGTSLAAAHVTGVLALLLSKSPRTSPREIQAVLERTARGLGESGKDRIFGSGLVDACRALDALAGGGTCR